MILPLALLLQAAPALPGPAESGSCRKMRGAGDIVATDHACVTLGRTHIFDGLYLDEFERQIFLPGATSLSDLRSASRERWLDMRPGDLDAVHRVQPVDARAGDMRPRVFRVRFVGAETIERCPRAGDPPGLCYGHMGASHRLVVIDRLLSATYVGEVPPYLPS